MFYKFLEGTYFFIVLIKKIEILFEAIWSNLSQISFFSINQHYLKNVWLKYRSWSFSGLNSVLIPKMALTFIYLDGLKILNMIFSILMGEC